jgi:zinc D-Ala-D-Ala carboxypeptidase
MRIEFGVWLGFVFLVLVSPPVLVGSDDSKVLNISPIVEEEFIVDMRCPQSHEGPNLSFLHLTKTQGLPPEYVPMNLVDIEDGVPTEGVVCLTAETARALVRLIMAAEDDTIHLRIFSGYRTPEDQSAIARKWRAIEGSMVERAVAPPRFSEHQTGTAIDLTAWSVKYAKAQNGFEKSQEFQWLADHAWKFGFNLSYPRTLKNGERGEYRFEPWHWRYVGVETAAVLYGRGLSYNELVELPETATTTLSAASEQGRIVQY